MSFHLALRHVANSVWCPTLLDSITSILCIGIHTIAPSPRILSIEIYLPTVPVNNDYSLTLKVYLKITTFSVQRLYKVVAQIVKKFHNSSVSVNKDTIHLLPTQTNYILMLLVSPSPALPLLPRTRVLCAHICPVFGIFALCSRD